MVNDCDDESQKTISQKSITLEDQEKKLVEELEKESKGLEKKTRLEEREIDIAKEIEKKEKQQDKKTNVRKSGD